MMIKESCELYTMGHVYRDIAVQSTFTNKVDIWALGCIMGELLTGDKIFDGDWAVYRYHISTSELNLTLPGSIPRILQRHVNQLLVEFLQRDYWKRPQVAMLCPLFNSYLLLVHHSVSETFNLVSLLAEYSQWKELVCKCPSQHGLVAQLFDHFKSTGNYKAAIVFGMQLIREQLQKHEYWLQLEDLYDKSGDDNYAVAGWRSLVEFHPSIATAHFNFTVTCLRIRGHSLACRHWRQLYETHLTNQIFADRYEEVATRRLMIEDWDRAVVMLKELVHKSSKELWYQDELRRALVKDGADKAIAIWTDLVAANSVETSFQDQLWSACRLKTDKTAVVRAWQGLVERHPDFDDLYFQLNIALAEAGNVVAQATAVWSQLLDRHPQSHPLHTHFYEKSTPFGPENRHVVWTTLATQYPALTKYSPPITQVAPIALEVTPEGGPNAVPAHTLQSIKAVGMYS